MDHARKFAENQEINSTVFTPEGEPVNIAMTAMPKIPGLFIKLLLLSSVRTSTLLPDTLLKNAVMGFDNYAMDRKKLDGFKRVCGYKRDTDIVPAPFIQTLFIGLISRLIGTGYFPITPMGLIQVGQSFELLQPIRQDTRLNLSCRLLDMTQTQKGINTRIHMEARKAGSGLNDAPVWQGMALYFTRAKHPGPKTKKQIEDIPLPIRETIEIPTGTGRRYAAVSGDFNPHHLYGWTAKLMGFKQPIAHGMWSLARACASMEKALDYPETYRVEGSFKLPIFIPAAVTLGYEVIDASEKSTGERRQGSVMHFELRDEKKGGPHLKGSFW